MPTIDYIWADQALTVIQELPRQPYTGERIRWIILDRGLQEPPHHNHWGMLIKMAIDYDLLIPTGRYEPMQEPSSHGRRTEIYMIPIAR